MRKREKTDLRHYGAGRFYNYKEYIQACFSTSGNPASASIIATMKPSRLRTTHIQDNHGRFDEHVPPYSGDIEWEKVMHAFKQSGYSSAFNFEVPYTTRNIPAIFHDDVIRYVYKLGTYLLSLE